MNTVHRTSGGVAGYGDTPGLWGSTRGARPLTPLTANRALREGPSPLPVPPHTTCERTEDALTHQSDVTAQNLFNRNTLATRRRRPVKRPRRGVLVAEIDGLYEALALACTRLGPEARLEMFLDVAGALAAHRGRSSAPRDKPRSTLRHVDLERLQARIDELDNMESAADGAAASPPPPAPVRRPRAVRGASGSDDGNDDSEGFGECAAHAMAGSEACAGGGGGRIIRHDQPAAAALAFDIPHSPDAPRQVPPPPASALTWRRRLRTGFAPSPMKGGGGAGDAAAAAAAAAAATSPSSLHPRRRVAARGSTASALDDFLSARHRCHNPPPPSGAPGEAPPPPPSPPAPSTATARRVSFTAALVGDLSGDDDPDSGAPTAAAAAGGGVHDRCTVISGDDGAASTPPSQSPLAPDADGPRPACSFQRRLPEF